MSGFGGKVEGTRLLLLDQGYMSAQGNPRSRPRIQAPDLAAAGPNSSPILGGRAEEIPAVKNRRGWRRLAARSREKERQKSRMKGLAAVSHQ
jgi:hypothetical protein